MRKSYKKKRLSCALCKPNKMGWDKRWTAKEHQERRLTEKEMKIYEGASSLRVQWDS